MKARFNAAKWCDRSGAEEQCLIEAVISSPTGRVNFRADAFAPESSGLPSEPDPVAQEQAAGHKPESKPAQAVVTAACVPAVSCEARAGEGMFIDFGHLKSQLSLLRVLERMGLSSRLRGGGWPSPLGI